MTRKSSDSAPSSADQRRGSAARSDRAASAERRADNSTSTPREASTEHGWLTVFGATQNNLKNIDVAIPLGRFVCVTGVSGSGKSSLVNDILAETLARDLNKATDVRPGACRRIDGLELLDKIIVIDQSPIGRTPRSNPATYIKLFDLVRDLYAELPDAKVRGFTKSRFSFNVTPGDRGGGRCEACEGNGSTRLDMDFLADVWVTCPVCAGRRFSRETLQMLYKGKSISDVLDMDVQQALQHFENQPKIAVMLQTFHDVGLDYIKLGQPSPTLSGGEAQRVKLARELVKIATGRTLYVLDEPTTGLHFEDVRKLLEVLHRLVDAGNTVVVVEHNLDVVKTADWVIDLGPEGGTDGGRIVVEGTPEDVSATEGSHTGEALRAVLTSNAECGMRNAEMVESGVEGRSERQRRRSADRTASTIEASHSAFRIPPSACSDAIRVVGACEHNLKNVSLDVPHHAMTVFCGPSGSGKSSLAIDTLYVEGQRRYIESFSAYARQFLGQMQKPRVEHIEGLAPAICIEQKAASTSPRSTVGTVTETYDYLRVVWARLAQTYCPHCRTPVGTQTSEQIVERVMALPEGTKAALLAPIEREAQETYADLFERERRQGYARVRVDGRLKSLDEPIDTDERRGHRVELVIDRVVIKAPQRGRISDSIEHALSRGNGVLLVVTDAQADANATVVRAAARNGEMRFSQHRACDGCGESFDELTPHHFSFNSRLGWCEACEGLGVQMGANVEAIIGHPSRSILDGAVVGWRRIEPECPLGRLICAVADHMGFDPARPWKHLTEAQKRAFLHGTGAEWVTVPPPSGPRVHVQGGLDADFGESSGFATPRARSRRLPAVTLSDPLAGVRVRWRGFYPAIHRATVSNWTYRQRIGDMATEVTCQACGGSRLRPDASAARLRNRTIFDVCNAPLGEALRWFENLKLDPQEKRIAGEVVGEVIARLRFLVDVGLDYVTLHRTAPTLSGGESQRIRLASQLGTGLTGVLYVLDEPTIGLHPRDNQRLIRALLKLRDLGNTLLAVEHDREVIDAADLVVDFGPGAGRLGGEVVARETPEELRRHADSLTGKYLSQRESIPVPSNRRPIAPDEARANWLVIRGARHHNLKGIDVALPLERFTCVTGVSGSGKSTLVMTILQNALLARINRATVTVGAHDSIDGVAHIDKIITVDQAPIGMTPTSTPATYTGIYDLIREVFARVPDARMCGYTPGRFSFNMSGGRCEACEGMGQRRIEMHFLPDVWVECDQCRGTRFEPETLKVQFRGKTIADVLNMSVREAIDLFDALPKVRRMLQTLDDVGLGYLPLGQSAATLSGGEAQRVKLATELGKPSTGRTLYVLDEPTTGLHFDDLKKLLSVLHRLVDLGNTVVCIEHNLDVIKTADHVIDLGPEAGEEGGRVVVEGAPEVVAAHPTSHTGRALKPVLQAGPVETRPVWKESQQKEVESDLTKPMRIQERAKAPWQVDGRKWHLEDRRAAGEKVLWDAKVVEWLVERIEALEGFEPADWSNRASIELRTTTKEATWFCHILTGGAQLIDVNLRVPTAAFSEDALNRQLGIKTLDERDDLPIYGAWSRVIIRPAGNGWDQIRILVCDFKDVDRKVWTAFLREAAAAHLRAAAAVIAAVESPRSQVDAARTGRAQHLKPTGSDGVRRAWGPETLLGLIGQFERLESSLAVDFSDASAVVLRRGSEEVARIHTGDAKELRVMVLAPRAALTPSIVEPLGRDPRVQGLKGGTYVIFGVRSMNDVPFKALRDLYRANLAGADGRSRARVEEV